MADEAPGDGRVTNMTAPQAGMDVLFFTRGRGKGHAVPDLAIARELRECCKGIRIQFVSYAIGTEVLAAGGEAVVDLEMPEANPVFETLTKAGRLINDYRPRLVVSHEELAVLPVADMFGVDAVFLSHWFPPSQDPFTDTLRYATEVLFMERPGLFPEPHQVKGRVRYLGPFVRRLTYGPWDRDRARTELGLSDEETMILVSPGSPPERLTPTADLILEAFDLLNYKKKRLVWVAGKDCKDIATRVVGRADVDVVESDSRLDRLMVACDAAVTKATYNIGRELAALGVRSVSLSHGLNFIDDMYAQAWATTTVLYVRETTPSMLARSLADSVRMKRAEPDVVALKGESAAVLARAVGSALARAGRRGQDGDSAGLSSRGMREAILGHNREVGREHGHRCPVP